MSKHLPDIVVDSQNTTLQVPSILMKENRTLFLWGDIDEDSSFCLVSSIFYLNMINSDPIHLLINSGGGNVIDGLAIYDIMQKIDCPVFTYCIGECSSMAAVLLAGGDYRYAYPSARIMIHEGSGGVNPDGKTGDIKAQTRELARLDDEVNKILSKRTGHSIKKLKKDQEKDFYMSAKEALEYCLIDEILLNE